MAGVWKESVILCLVFTLAKYAFANSYFGNDQLEKDEIIDVVNNANTTWVAGRNFHPSIKSGYSKILLGLKIDPKESRLPELVDKEDDTDLPENFDAREKWKDCVGLQTVRDQGECGSCWAVSSASAFTDRLCIATKGQFNGELSALDLLSCGPGSGCQGGFPFVAFKYFESTGIVTGGDYNSSKGCQPYPLSNCDHHVNGTFKNCGKDYKPTPECQTTCTNMDYKEHSFQKDLHFIKIDSSFTISGDVKLMQKEIFNNGPLVASFLVYEDFFSYKSGVYTHQTGIYKGGHAVKVIGWGVENGIDYWLVANSWNTEWGDKGFVKIKRGTNECDFEEMGMVGGMPKID